MLSTEAVTEFKQIYKEVFGIELSDEEAAQQAQLLLQLFICLLGEKFVQ